MNISEYESVKDFEYPQYCDYLQNKYGIGLSDYMRKSWTKNPKCSRTKEGLLAHHKFEDHTIQLSHPNHAKQHPFEWQAAKNIVYCDCLEHLLLHILIYEKEKGLGIGGILTYMVPELNDVYSGWCSKQQWQQNCHDLIIHDKDVYLTLLQRFIEESGFPRPPIWLFSSFNEKYGAWSKNNNIDLFNEMNQL